MRRLFLILGLVLAVPSWAGSPTSWDVRPAGGVLEVEIVGSLAASAVDTVVVDMKDARWSGSTAGVGEALMLCIAQIDSDPDSILVAANALVHNSATGTASVASTQVTGTGQAQVDATVFARFFQFIITNDSADSTDSYELRIQVPRK